MTQRFTGAALVACFLAGAAMAQDATATEVAAAGAVVERGAVTNLPLPRFVSMKSMEGNVRRGPSLSHRIDWVYRLKDLPLRITAEYGHWRRVEDRDGQGGWVHYALLSGVRTILVEADEIVLRAQPDIRAPEIARARRGVVARIDRCGADWCRIRKDGHRGWVEKAGLWGVEPGEIIE